MLPRWERFYEKMLRGALRGWRPYIISLGTLVLLFIAFGGFGASIGSQRTKVEFFPDNTPNQIIVYIEYPQGTDIEKTNLIMKDLEERVYKVLNSPEYVDNGYNFLVESAVSQVGAGSGNPQTDGGSTAIKFLESLCERLLNPNVSATVFASISSRARRNIICS